VASINLLWTVAGKRVSVEASMLVIIVGSRGKMHAISRRQLLQW
jgi:hypothetical protein